jgi:hypothetical protein
VKTTRIMDVLATATVLLAKFAAVASLPSGDAGADCVFMTCSLKKKHHMANEPKKDIPSLDPSQVTCRTDLVF